MSCASAAPSAATAALASRAETPMRKPPVTSLISAQRPVSSSASSQRASRAGNSALAKRREGFDDGGEGESWAPSSPPPCGEGLGASVANRERGDCSHCRPTPLPDPPPQGGGNIAGASDAPATSARRSRKGRRHNRRTVRTAPGRCARRSGCGSGRPWHAESSRLPVSAANAQPRSGSDVERK